MLERHTHTIFDKKNSYFGSIWTERKMFFYSDEHENLWFGAPKRRKKFGNIRVKLKKVKSPFRQIRWRITVAGLDFKDRNNLSSQDTMLNAETSKWFNTRRELNCFLDKYELRALKLTGIKIAKKPDSYLTNH